MFQKDGEFQTLHTLMGLTGADLGFSLQAKEENDSFGLAVKDCLSPDAIQQVRMLYTDAPSEGMLDHVPNLMGCAEDRVHFPMRAEYCTGGKPYFSFNRSLKTTSSLGRAP